VITFLTGFLPALAILVQQTKFEDFEKAGLVGGLFVVVRLLIKAGYEGLSALIIWAAEKVRNRK
jgi:hypothetical protein